jgi:hypothetical protein
VSVGHAHIWYGVHATGLFRRKDQVAALESERRAKRSFRQEEKEHENDRCRGAARSGHCFARAGAENSVTARRTVRAKCRRHLSRLFDEGMAAAGQLVKAGLPILSGVGPANGLASADAPDDRRDERSHPNFSQMSVNTNR